MVIIIAKFEKPIKCFTDENIKKLQRLLKYIGIANKKAKKDLFLSLFK